MRTCTKVHTRWHLGMWHEDVPKQKWGVSCEEYLSPSYQTVIDSVVLLLLLKIFINLWTAMNSCWNFDFIVFYSSSSLHVNTTSGTTLFYVAHGSEHEWLFNILKVFLLQKVSTFITNGGDNNENYMSPGKVSAFCRVIVLKHSCCCHLDG